MGRKLSLMLLLAAMILAIPVSGAGSAPLFQAPILDPALRGLLRQSDERVADILATAAFAPDPPPFLRSSFPPGDALPPGQIDVFLEFYGDAPSSDKFVSFGDEIYGARLSVTELRAHVESGLVRRARMARPLLPVLDQSGSRTGFSRLRTYNRDTEQFDGVAGRGVIVGIVDSGIDFNHPDFRQGTSAASRLLSFWDQGAPTGPHPAGFAFGIEFPATILDREDIVPIDATGHGTHVAGIAAGNGFAARSTGEALYVGVAPEASIIGVRTLFTEFTVAAGVDYVFRRAEALGRPAVVNLSLGSQFGPHRGTSPFERALDGLVQPGRLIVAAAGNDGHKDIHAELVLETGDTRTLGIRFPSYLDGSTLVNFVDTEGWFDRRDRYRFTVIGPDGDDSFVVNEGDEELTAIGTRGRARAWYTEDLDQGTLALALESNPSGLPASGAWRLRIEALEIGGSGELDFWIVGWFANGGQEPRFLDFVDATETVSVPGTAKNVLTVGAQVTRDCWPTGSGLRCYPEQSEDGDVAFFSGRGPTSDGRVKPDVIAPGYGVVAPLARTVRSFFFTPEELALLSTPGGRYWSLRGTSMAAPHVTGTVALLLERFPKLTIDQARARIALRGPAIEDQRSGEVLAGLHTGRILAPVTSLFISEIVPEMGGLRIRWNPTKENGPVQYTVFRGFSPMGPYHRLADSRIEGNNPYSILDSSPETGREHIYRIVATGPSGIEEDLDTLRIAVPGPFLSRLRPPDPNPARESVSIRFFLAPSAAGGRYEIDIVDVRGRRVRTLTNAAFDPAGEELVVAWDRRTDDGRRAVAGIYFVRLRWSAMGSGDGDSGSTSFQGRRSEKIVLLP